MKLYIRALLCCLCISTAAAANDNLLVHKTHAERLRVLSAFYNDTISRSRFDSAYVFRTINKLSQLAADNKDDDLAMEADVLRLIYYSRDPRFSPAVVTKIDAVIHKAEKENRVWAQILAENAAASYYYGRRYYEHSFEHSQQLFDLLKNLSVDEFPYKQSCLLNIGTRYYKFGDYKEALFYFLLALQSEPTFRLYQHPRQPDLLNSTGLTYQHLGNIDSANYYFRQSYSLAVQLDDTAFQGIAQGNLGYNLYLEKKYDEATPLLQKDVDIAMFRRDWGLASGSLMALGAISMERGNYDMAERQLLEVRALIFRSRQLHRLPDAYPLLAKLYIAKGEPALANRYMDSSFYWKDSVAKRFSGERILAAKQKIELQTVNNEVKLADGKRRSFQAQRNILIAFILAFAGGAFYYNRLRTRKNMLQAALLEKKNKELVAAKRQLDDFAKSISEKNEVIELLELQNSQESSETLDKLRKSTILTDDDWDYYQELFEKAHPGFFDRLKQKVPGLTPAETRFMTLSKLNLTGKEMAKILGVGADAIRQYRSRVRRKMQLGDDDDLGELTSNI